MLPRHNNNNNQESMPLRKYIGNKINFSFYHKLIIAKNVAEAANEYGNLHGYGSINLENMKIDKNTLKVTIENKDNAIIGIEIPYFGAVDSSIFYNAPETSRNSPLTEKSDVYTIVAIIIDIMNRAAPHQHFEDNELKIYYNQKVEIDPRFLNAMVKMKNQKAFDRQVLANFFSSNPVAALNNKKYAEHILSNKTIRDIEICPASFKRINQFNAGLDGWMSDDFMKREQKSLKDIFHRCLAIDPSLRPTQNELINILKRFLNVYVAEFYIQPCLTSISDRYQSVKKLINDNPSDDFSHVSEKLDNKKTALCAMVASLSKKEIIKARELRNFHEIIQNAYNEIINEVEEIVYVSNIKNQIEIVEETSSVLKNMIQVQRQKDEKIINNFSNSQYDILLDEFDDKMESRLITSADQVYSDEENKQKLFSVKSVSSNLGLLCRNQSTQVSDAEIQYFKQKSNHSISYLKYNLTHFGKEHKEELKKTTKAVHNLNRAINNTPVLNEIKFSEIEELNNENGTNMRLEAKK